MSLSLLVVCNLSVLFTVYLRSTGEDPKTHKVKEELDRIKSQMQRLQQINDKAKRPKVDTEAASRMIRHGINSTRQNRKRKTEVDENWENEQQEVAASSKSAKSLEESTSSQKKTK